MEQLPIMIKLIIYTYIPMIHLITSLDIQDVHVIYQLSTDTLNRHYIMHIILHSKLLKNN
jgi:hypothetical protein